MSGVPSLNIAFSNDNLLLDIQNIDGFAGFIGTGVTGGNIGKVFIISSLLDAQGQGITAATEPAAYRQIKEFYDELAGNQNIYVLLVANTVTMAQMLDYTSADYCNKLIAAGAGSISYLGVFKNPANGYDGGANFIDSDVAAAVTASKNLLTYQNSKLNFFRVLIEGRVLITNESSNTIYAPNEADNGYAGVVLGGSKADGSASVGTVLGRKVKYAAHIKVGKVANGSLTMSTAYIGSKPIKGDSTVKPPVAEVRATSTFVVTNKGTDGDILYLRLYNGGNFICDTAQFTKITAQNTEAQVAAAMVTLWNNTTYGNTGGFTFSAQGATITISAPVGSGSSYNGSTYIVQKSAGATIAVTQTTFAGGVTAVTGQTTLIESLYAKGYIGFLTYPNKAGFYCGIDYMASQDDYRILVHGAVVDAAAKVVMDVYLNQLEGEVDANPNGTITEDAAVYLEQLIINQVKTTLGERISGFTASVDRTVNIVALSKSKVKMRVQPKGYNTYIDVELGLGN